MSEPTSKIEKVAETLFPARKKRRLAVEASAKERAEEQAKQRQAELKAAERRAKAEEHALRASRWFADEDPITIADTPGKGRLSPEVMQMIQTMQRYGNTLTDPEFMRELTSFVVNWGWNPHDRMTLGSLKVDIATGEVIHCTYDSGLMPSLRPPTDDIDPAREDVTAAAMKEAEKTLRYSEYLMTEAAAGLNYLSVEELNNEADRIARRQEEMMPELDQLKRDLNDTRTYSVAWGRRRRPLEEKRVLELRSTLVQEALSQKQSPARRR